MIATIPARSTSSTTARRFSVTTPPVRPVGRRVNTSRAGVDYCGALHGAKRRVANRYARQAYRRAPVEVNILLAWTATWTSVMTTRCAPQRIVFAIDRDTVTGWLAD